MNLADYLDLLEPPGFAPGVTSSPAPTMSRTGFAPAAPQVVSRQLAWRQCLAAAPTAPTARATRLVPTFGPLAPIRRAYAPSFHVPSPDEAQADRNRRDCVAMCAANPGSPDCAPDAPGQPGSGGFCAPWLPGGTQGSPPPQPSQPGATPSCPDGYFWNGLRCSSAGFETDPGTPGPGTPGGATPQKSGAGLAVGVIAALVAWRLLRG
ncbi:MAG: hypothetical protein ACRCSL_04865 [Microbacterium sp.]